jgi:hypothetical protein
MNPSLRSGSRLADLEDEQVIVEEFGDWMPDQ